MTAHSFTPATQQGATIAILGIGATFYEAADQIPAVDDKAPTIDASNLATTGQREFLPGDLSDPGEFTISFQHDNVSALPNVKQPYLVTITAPLQSGQATAEKWAGTCICTGVKSPQFKGGANALQMCDISFKPDGGRSYFGSKWARTIGTST